ncbi:MAG: 50S ribosomal protein L24 [Planctomycetota bacterium]
MARHVVKGDTVMITAGDHKGKTGEIMRVLTKKDAVLIKGVNLRTKHLKPTQQNPQGGVITIEAPIHLSNVSPLDGSGKATRVRFEVKDDGSKRRLAASDGKELSKIRGPRKK